MVKGALMAASPDDTFPKGHLFVMMDGKAHSNGDKMVKAFLDNAGKNMPKHRKQLYQMTTEASERETKERLGGIGTVPTIEFVNLLTAETLCVESKKRLNCLGSNASDCLGPFERPKKTDLWHVKQSAKASLYGPALVEVGGKVEGDAGADKDPAPKANEMVPFSYHTIPTSAYEEYAHSYNSNGFWHLTATDTILPMLAVRKKLPYVGFCFTQEHVEALEKACINEIFKAMQDPKDPLYEPELAKLLRKDGASDPTPDGKAHGKPAAPAKPPAAAKPPTPAKPGSGGSTTKPGTPAAAAKPISAQLLDRLRQLDDGSDNE